MLSLNVLIAFLVLISVSYGFVVAPGYWGSGFGASPFYGGGGFGGGFSSFYNQGFYEDPRVHVHYHQPAYSAGGFGGGLFGGISQRDIFSGTKCSSFLDVYFFIIQTFLLLKFHESESYH